MYKLNNVFQRFSEIFIRMAFPIYQSQKSSSNLNIGIEVGFNFTDVIIEPYYLTEYGVSSRENYPNLNFIITISTISGNGVDRTFFEPRVSLEVGGSKSFKVINPVSTYHKFKKGRYEYSLINNSEEPKEKTKKSSDSKSKINRPSNRKAPAKVKEADAVARSLNDKNRTAAEMKHLSAAEIDAGIIVIDGKKYIATLKNPVYTGRDFILNFSMGLFAAKGSGLVYIPRTQPEQLVKMKEAEVGKLSTQLSQISSSVQKNLNKPLTDYDESFFSVKATVEDRLKVNKIGSQNYVVSNNEILIKDESAYLSDAETSSACEVYQALFPNHKTLIALCYVLKLLKIRMVEDGQKPDNVLTKLERIDRVVDGDHRHALTSLAELLCTEYVVAQYIGESTWLQGVALHQKLKEDQVIIIRNIKGHLTSLIKEASVNMGGVKALSKILSIFIKQEGHPFASMAYDVVGQIDHKFSVMAMNFNGATMSARRSLPIWAPDGLDLKWEPSDLPFLLTFAGLHSKDANGTINMFNNCNNYAKARFVAFMSDFSTDCAAIFGVDPNPEVEIDDAIATVQFNLLNIISPGQIEFFHHIWKKSISNKTADNGSIKFTDAELVAEFAKWCTDNNYGYAMALNRLKADVEHSTSTLMDLSKPIRSDNEETWYQAMQSNLLRQIDIHKTNIRQITGNATNKVHNLYQEYLKNLYILFLKTNGSLSLVRQEDDNVAGNALANTFLNVLSNIDLDPVMGSEDDPSDDLLFQFEELQGVIKANSEAGINTIRSKVTPYITSEIVELATKEIVKQYKFKNPDEFQDEANDANINDKMVLYLDNKDEYIVNILYKNREFLQSHFQTMFAKLGSDKDSNALAVINKDPQLLAARTTSDFNDFIVPAHAPSDVKINDVHSANFKSEYNALVYRFTESKDSLLQLKSVDIDQYFSEPESSISTIHVSSLGNGIILEKDIAIKLINLVRAPDMRAAKVGLELYNEISAAKDKLNSMSKNIEKHLKMVLDEKVDMPDDYRVKYYMGFKSNVEIVFSDFISLGLQNEYSENGFNMYLTLGFHIYKF